MLINLSLYHGPPRLLVLAVSGYGPKGTRCYRSPSNVQRFSTYPKYITRHTTNQGGLTELWWRSRLSTIEGDLSANTRGGKLVEYCGRFLCGRRSLFHLLKLVGGDAGKRGLIWESGNGVVYPESDFSITELRSNKEAGTTLWSLGMLRMIDVEEVKSDPGRAFVDWECISGN